MAETLTANYSWTKPDPGGSANTWGSTLNGDLDAIDAQVFKNQQAGVPVGSVTMFAVATPPTNWLNCDGSSLSTTTYATLFAIIGYAFGGSGTSFNLPNLQGVFPLGAGPSNALASTGGASSATLATANLPPHAHSITDVSHTHVASQPAHTHATGNGDVVISGTGLTPGGNNFALQAQLPLSTAQPTITVNPSGTGLSTTNNTGSGTPVPTVPPFISMNFIIRYQ